MKNKPNQVKRVSKTSPIDPRRMIQGKTPRTKKMHQNAAEWGNHSRAAKGHHGLAMGTTGRGRLRFDGGGSHNHGGRGLSQLFHFLLCPFRFSTRIFGFYCCFPFKKTMYLVAGPDKWVIRFELSSGHSNFARIRVRLGLSSVRVKFGVIEFGFGSVSVQIEFGLG